MSPTPLTLMEVGRVAFEEIDPTTGGGETPARRPQPDPATTCTTPTERRTPGSSPAFAPAGANCCPGHHTSCHASTLTCQAHRQQHDKAPEQHETPHQEPLPVSGGGFVT